MMAFFPKSGPNPFTMVTKRLRQDLPDRKFLQYGPNTYVSNKMVVAWLNPMIKAISDHREIHLPHRHW